MTDEKEFTYEERENLVISDIQERLELSRGDAQAILGGQPFLASTSWGKGLDPQETSEIIAPKEYSEDKSKKSLESNLRN